MLGRRLSDGSLQIDALDGLRGFAVLIVILAHTGNAGFHLIPGLNFSGAGHSGVFLFFELSSFLLTYSFIAHGRSAFSKDRLITYFERRFFRIYPLYFLYLTVALITTFLVSVYRPSAFLGVPMALSPSEYLQQLLMLDGKGITWSIPVEFHYYFLLPLVAFGIVRLCQSRALPTIAFVAGILVVVALLWPLDEARSVRSVIYHLPIFFCGAVLALFHHLWVERGYNSSRRAGYLLESFGLAAFTANILLTPSILQAIDLGSYSFKPHRQFYLFAFLWGAVIFAAIHGNGPIGAIFRHRWLRHLGFVSFSAYLLHPMFISGIAKTMLKDLLPSFLAGWLVLALTLVLSWISFSVIEQPMSRYSFRSIWRPSALGSGKRS